MSAVRRSGGLGRGMASLIPMNEAVADTLFSRGPSATDVLHGSDQLQAVEGARLADVGVDAIRPNPQQPRRDFDVEATRELEHSIRENGVLQPIVVRPVAGGGAIGYELVMGERRLRAAKALGHTTIPAVVKETSDDEMLQQALLENLHRLQLTALEEASAYQQLIQDFGVSHDELADRIGRSRSMVTNTLRLLTLPEPIQRKVAAGLISAAHGRALLPLKTLEPMERMVDRIVTEDLSVRAVEAAVKTALGPAKRLNSRGRRAEQLTEIAERLQSRFDTRVAVSMGPSKGKIVIDFGSAADLNRILEALGEERWEQGEAAERMFAARASALRRTRV